MSRNSVQRIAAIAIGVAGLVPAAVEAQTAPDLTVGLPSVTDSSPETEGSFTLSATVSNAGDGESAATTLRFYRSTDATITTSDTSVGTDAVVELGPSGRTSAWVQLTAPAMAGTYYYGACVDAVADESDTTNNCSGSVTVEVSSPPAVPDLQIKFFVIATSPTTMGPGPLKFRVYIHNAGAAASAATTLRIYQSADATITTSDTELATAAVAAIDPFANQDVRSTVSRPEDALSYYYGVCVDAVTDESDTTHNCLGSLEIPTTDLVVDSSSTLINNAFVRSLVGDGADRRRDVAVHPVGHGTERWGRGVGTHDAALLPVGGRDDHDGRHGGGHGRAGGTQSVGEHE